jgi:predicted membrane chloride channel (bestrophin family)
MIDYRAGVWGFHVAAGWHGSLAPRALAMAVPNAMITLLLATLLQNYGADYGFAGWSNDDVLMDIGDDNWAQAYPSVTTAHVAQSVITVLTSTLIFVLYNRSRTSYSRWWEGGTLLQKTRGEWFNAYSSIMAFMATNPELQAEVDSYMHLVARLFSLLMCCGLQQVSPNRDRPFEIIDLAGIEPGSMEYLNTAPDKVEVILQWIQRSMVLNSNTGVLMAPPPILSRAFQEVSRGIVNLQNARKIADFPYPFPLAQVCMILQLLHWLATPFVAVFAFPRPWAVLLSFFTIFVLWCIHFNALDLEFPFGARVNDLPMNQFQEDWNKSLMVLIDRRAHRAPVFQYDPAFHDKLEIVMSDASALFAHKAGSATIDRGVAVIKVEDKRFPTNRVNHARQHISQAVSQAVSLVCVNTSTVKASDADADFGSTRSALTAIPTASPTVTHAAADAQVAGQLVSELSASGRPAYEVNIGGALAEVQEHDLATHNVSM